jgi:hypothetical protein
MAIERSRTETTRDFTGSHAQHALGVSIGRGAGVGWGGTVCVRTFLGHGLLCGIVVAGWECGRTDGRPVRFDFGLTSG